MERSPTPRTRQYRFANYLLPFAITAFIIGIAVYGLKNAQHSALGDLQKAVSLLEHPRELPAFAMTNHFGSEFSNQDLNEHWNFIFFGFTHCPDVCPLTLNIMAHADSMLDAGFQKQFIFISVDPDRDRPDRLKEYISHFSDSIIGLTGSKEQIDSLSRSLGTIYVIPENTSGNYLVDHSAHLFVVAPNGTLVSLFSTPHDADIIADDFKIISAAYRQKYKS